MTSMVQIPFLLLQLGYTYWKSRKSPPGFKQLNQDNFDFRAFLKKWFFNLPFLSLTGVALSLHIVAWSWSINHTTIPLALLFVNTTPIILVGWAALTFFGLRILGYLRPKFCPSKVSAWDGEEPEDDLALLPLARRTSEEEHSREDEEGEGEEAVEGGRRGDGWRYAEAREEEAAYDHDPTIRNDFEFEEESRTKPGKESTGKKPGNKGQPAPPTLMEFCGACMGLLVSALIVIGTALEEQSESGPNVPASWTGNLGAWIGAVLYAVYLKTGKISISLR